MMNLNLRRVTPVIRWQAIVDADSDPHTRVFESECAGSAEVDRVTVYVDPRSRMVTVMVDYSPFLDTRRVRGLTGGRRTVQGQRPGSVESFLDLLASYGLKEDTESKEGE